MRGSLCLSLPCVLRVLAFAIDDGVSEGLMYIDAFVETEMDFGVTSFLTGG